MKNSKPHEQNLPHALSPDVLNIDLRRLQAFILAARTQSFGTAAQSLNVVPSAVSHGIRSLEAELGCALFQRHGPKVTLTRAGLRLIPFATEVLNRIHELRDAARLFQSQGETLRIAVPEMLCARLLPAILPEFHECLPGVTLAISAATSLKESWDNLRKDKTDLLLCVTSEAPQDILQRPLFTETLHFYVAAEHPLHAKKTAHLQDLQPYAILTCDADARNRLGILCPENASMAAPHIELLPSIESVQSMAQASSAIALLPSWAVHSYSKTLHPLHLQSPELQRVCSAFWHADSKLIWAMEVLLGLIELHGQEVHERMSMAMASLV